MTHSKYYVMVYVKWWCERINELTHEQVLDPVGLYIEKRQKEATLFNNSV